MQQKADVVPDPPASIWTRNVLILALTVFFARFGQGLQGVVSPNFLVHDLGLGGDQVLWLAGVREIPGLGLMFLTALIMRLPQSHRAFWSLLLMGFGYGCYYFIINYNTRRRISMICINT